MYLLLGISSIGMAEVFGVSAELIFFFSIPLLYHVQSFIHRHDNIYMCLLAAIFDLYSTLKET